MPDEQQGVHLSDEDIEFLVSLLRSATTVMTTNQLVEALRANLR